MLKKVIVKLAWIFVAAGIIAISLFAGFFASAANSPCPGGSRTTSINLQVPIPGLGKCVDGFPQYLMYMYKFLVGSIGLIAVVMIMVGGFKWILAAGNSSRIEDAKTTIFSAVAGLLIALGSYTILNLINPNLTNLKVTALPKVTGELILYDTCPNTPEFECGYYYTRNKQGKKTGSYKGGDQKEQIQKLTKDQNVCRGVYCSVGQNQVGSCFPSDARLAFYLNSITYDDSIGFSSSCKTIDCPRLGSEDAKKGCKFYTTQKSLTEAEMYTFCEEDKCNLSKTGNGCEFLGVRLDNKRYRLTCVEKK